MSYRKMICTSCGDKVEFDPTGNCIHCWIKEKIGCECQEC